MTAPARSNVGIAESFDELPGCIDAARALEPYSDFPQQWGAADRVASPKKVWRRRNNAARPSRRAHSKATTSRLYQNKSPRPTWRGDLRGLQGEAQPSPVAASNFATTPELPKYVQQCARRGGRGWSVWLWQHSNPHETIRVQYTCRSWRCEGDCQRAAAAQLYARLKEATDRSPASEWVFFVFTIDRHGFYSEKPWKDAQDAYRALGKMTENA